MWSAKRAGVRGRPRLKLRAAERPGLERENETRGEGDMLRMRCGVTGAAAGRATTEGMKIRFWLIGKQWREMRGGRGEAAMEQEGRQKAVRIL